MTTSAVEGRFEMWWLKSVSVVMSVTVQCDWFAGFFVLPSLAMSPGLPSENGGPEFMSAVVLLVLWGLLGVCQSRR